MTRLEAAEQLLSEMSRAEKAQVLQWVVRDLGEVFPGIESRPDVCGGEPCIVRTRIPVWLLVKARQLGTSEADLLRCYPGLRAEDLVNAWAYARAHTEEIEQQIRENGAAHLVPTREDALKALRGSGRGERLVERLLQSRREDRPAIVPPTPEEDAAITAAAESDPDAQPLTDAQLAAMVPLRSLRGRPKSERR